MAEPLDVIRWEDLERFKSYWALKPGDEEVDVDRLGERAGRRELGIEVFAWDGLDSDGWIVLTPHDRVEEALEDGRRPEGIAEALRVYRASGEYMVLVTWRATLLFREDVHEAEALRRMSRAGLTVLRAYDWMVNAFSVEIPRNQDPVRWVGEVRGLLEDVLRDGIPELLTPLRPRSSPTLGAQWQLDNTGQSGGTPAADVHAPSAWEVTEGEGLRIAVIDQGFRHDHVDIKDDVLGDSGHFDGTDPVMFQRGRDKLATTEWDHGTACAALAAGHPAPGRGLRGVAPKAKLLLLSISSWKSGEQIGAAIRYAASSRLRLPNFRMSWLRPFAGWEWRFPPMAHVITCSLQTGLLGTSGKEAAVASLGYAAEHGRGGKGVPVFWAADNADIPISDDYMGGDPRTITVADTDHEDHSDPHAYGPELDFVAPGENVVTSLAAAGADHWGEAFGSSFATPLAAGIAALVLDVHPRLTAAQVRTVMRETCEKVGGADYVGGHHKYYGYGRVNAACAVRAALVMLKMNLP